MKSPAQSHSKTLLASKVWFLPIACAAAAWLTSAANSQAVSASFTGGTSGSFSFDDGTLWTTSTGATGTAPGFDSGSTTAAPTTLTNTDTATIPSRVTSTTTLTLTNTRNLQNITFGQGGGTVTINGAAIYLTDGGTVLHNGVISNLSTPLFLQGSATFTANGSSAGRSLTIGSTVTGSNTGTLNLNGSSTTATNSITGAITGSNLSIAKSSASVWQLSNGGNTFGGGLSISGGTIIASASGNSSAGLGTGTVTMSGGAITLNGASAVTVNNTLALSNTNTIYYRNSGTFNPAALTGTGILNIAPTAGAAGSGSGGTAAAAAITVTGASFGAYGGAINLSGVSSTITNTVNVAASALANTTGTVNVLANAILTSSVANVTSGSALAIAGGTVSPNGTSVGMLTLTNDKSFSMSSGMLMLTLASTSSYDQIVASGLGNASTFSLTGGTLDLGGVTAAAGQSYQIFNGFVTAGNTVSGISITNFAPGDGSMPSLSTSGVLSFAAVPEPSAFVGVSLLMALAGWRERRRLRGLFSKTAA